ncbi:MAG: hypothetical protein RR131_08110 [Anaerovorax sp.]
MATVEDGMEKPVKDQPKRKTGNMRPTQSKDEAIEKAIRECIEEDILRDFLSKHGGEIYNIYCSIVLVFQEL